MNLIVTPVYKSFDIVERMCDAIDRYSVMPYVHVLVDDDSGAFVPIKQPTSPNARRVLQIRRDVPNVIHKNGLGQALQLGKDFATQAFCNEVPNAKIDNVFVIESDVIVQEEGWDRKQIELIPTLPDDWGTLDLQSIDEEGKVTYPCTVSPRHDEFTTEKLEWIHYPDFQVTLFNNKTFNEGIRFDTYPSHFDVMFGRNMEALGMKAYRTKELKALHINGGGNSRQFLT